MSGWLLSAVPALAFMGLVKLVLAPVATTDTTLSAVQPATTTIVAESPTAVTTPSTPATKAPAAVPVTDHLAKAGYLAKYATKSTEATGYSSTRLDDDTIGEHDPDGDHIARLITACWRLGRPTPGPPSRSRPPADRSRPSDGSPFGKPWDCPDCGTHTRYRACPVCVAERQASLDTKPANAIGSTTAYPRLRRWAHRFGFAGHFLTKTRRRVVKFQTLRDTRIVYRRAADQAPADPGTVHAVDHIDETTLIVGTLTFAGVGWHNNGDAMLANTAAAIARARHETGREELAHEAGSAVPLALQAA